VYEWAKYVAQLDNEDANILRVNKVTGSALLSLTEEELYKEPYKMPGGPAIRLEIAKRSLVPLYFGGLNRFRSILSTFLPI
jgi:hypothetical protein